MRLSRSSLDALLIHPVTQGTALFMSGGLLTALESMKLRRVGPTATHFDFQHRLCYDLESLIWVVVYAMMIHRRNALASADPETRELYKSVLDVCWAVHAYSNVFMSHNHVISIGCSAHSGTIVSFWFPDPREATFFREAMRLLRKQEEGEPLMYEGLCAFFNKHIDQAKEP